jgi:hypothetical protein
MRYVVVFFLLCLFFNSELRAQKIENVRASSTDEKVTIVYEITGAKDGQKFKIRLYGSHDNYTTPLSFVSGDVGQGNELSAGSKRVEWDPKAELKEFDGEITFEVRAEIIISPVIKTPDVAPVQNATNVEKSEVIKILAPSITSKQKRGKYVQILWQGIQPSQLVKLELLKGGQTVTSIGEVSYKNDFPWQIPKGTKTGKDYQVKLTANNVSVVSDNFTIKPKVPFILKALPVVVVGGVVAVLAGGSGGGGGGGVKPDPSLPSPPSVPE